MKILLINRKTRTTGNFSIESYVNTVFKQMNNSGQELSLFYSSFYSNGFFTRIKALIEVSKLKADVFHVSGDVHYLALALPSRQTILTVHDCAFLKTANPLKRFLLWLFWLKWPVSRVAIVTCVSEATKREIINYTACDERKIKLIPTVVDKRFAYLPKTFSKDSCTLLHIGTKPNKNLERLLVALNGLEVKLMVVGIMNPQQLKLAAENNIRFENYFNLSFEALLALYQQCDILSFCSTIEGFGMPIIEANKVGRVVLTSNCSSMPEVAGNAAHLVDPFDVQAIRMGLLRLIEDENYRNQLIVNGLANAKRFDADKAAADYLALYEKLAKVEA